MDKKIPLHIAFIMDGNGRWAKNKNMPRNYGHEAGAKTVEKVIKKARELGVKYITLFAFSTENWSRPQREIDSLMKLLSKTLARYNKDSKKNNTRLIISGRREKLPENILKDIDNVVESTKNNTAITVNLALNYGARQEITDAIKKLVSQGKKEITEQDISACMYQPGIPDPDLIIRTSGEKRISNFLLWQSAYSEFYFTPVLWPDFDGAELEKAVTEFQARIRRYGGI
ncbi:Undecaprenyl diphosphate synthase [Elusimicrobium minutum Pei191]|uniref:Isoprenyl transferase n=2 Tax=Elusimicrobium TaxID=423604 RepID=B2KCL4_ELUMP|nr:Undecaprenyl diphosphate synthase [Elusimicrobium minutum Pei191]